MDLPPMAFSLHFSPLIRGTGELARRLSDRGRRQGQATCPPESSREWSGLADNLVRLDEKGSGDRQSEGLGGLEIDK